MKKNISMLIFVLLIGMFFLISCGGGGGGDGSTNGNTADDTSQSATYDARGNWKWNNMDGAYIIFTLEGTLEGGNLTGQAYGAVEHPWHYAGTYVVNGIQVEMIFYCIEIGKKEPLLIEGHFLDDNTIYCDRWENIEESGSDRLLRRVTE